MNVIARYLVVENAQSEPLAGLEEPAHPVAPVAGKLQQKPLPVASTGQVPYVAGQLMAIPSRHHPLLATMIPAAKLPT